MSRTVSILVRTSLMAFVVIAPAVASAQGARQFVYFAPGNEVDRESRSQTYAAGVGLERALEQHLAIQVDVAALSYFDKEDSRTVGGIASFDAVVNVLPQTRVDPFVTAGYSLQFRDDTTNMFNFGGGVRHWFREDRALLVEFRDHRAKEGAVPRRFWHVRIGLVFR